MLKLEKYISAYSSFIEKIDLKYFWFLVLFLSAYKNILMNKFYLAHDTNYYHYPVFNFLSDIPKIFDIILLAFGLGIIFLVFAKKVYYQAIPFFFNGILNFYFQSSDIFLLHHDTQVSSLIFFTYGIYLIFGKTNKSIKPLIAVSAITFFGSGLVKISPDFLSGEITAYLIQRAEAAFYWPIFSYFKLFSVELSYYAMFVEIVEPLLLIFTTGIAKAYFVIIASPFHLGLLLTGTGTVYNTIYPVAFLQIILHENLKERHKSKLIKNSILTLGLVYNILILIYCLLITFKAFGFKNVI